MSDSEPSRVYKFEADSEMLEAYEQARVTFRYFWRENFWERRRIVPALDLACVKAPFTDEEAAERVKRGQPEEEHMWLGEIDFDGRFVSGELLNAPNWLKTVKEGDPARFRLCDISDWMYVIRGEAYGAHTVNLMRSRMGPAERKDHDNAWGLDFGDPKKVRLVPKEKGWFAKGKAEFEEHPMSEAMAPGLKEYLANDPARLLEKDEKGWTLLHHESLAGNARAVEILVESGADINATTPDGVTPIRLAKALGWDKVVALLAGRGAT